MITPALYRTCDDNSCNGKLKKTGVRYGQTVPEEPLRKAEEYADKADLVLVLGSSMTTSPFCNLPMLSKHFVICNKQKTPYDKKASLCIHDTIDNFMSQVVNHINPNAEIKFCYQQDFIVFEQNEKIIITTPRHQEPAVFIEEATLIFKNGTRRSFEKQLNGEFVFHKELLDDGFEHNIEIEFKGGFNIPNITVVYKVGEKSHAILEKIVNF